MITWFIVLSVVSVIQALFIVVCVRKILEIKRSLDKAADVAELQASILGKMVVQVAFCYDKISKHAICE